jgi:hypothetical protein
MKINLKILVIIFLFFGFFFLSCKKYPEGPCISLRSAKDRVYSFKYMRSYTVDGVDSIGYLTQGQIISTDFYYSDNDEVDYFEMKGPKKDGSDFHWYWKWNLDDHNRTLVMKWPKSPSPLGIFGSYTELRWNILRLTNTEIKMETTVDGHVHKVDLLPRNIN